MRRAGTAIFAALLSMASVSAARAQVATTTTQPPSNVPQGTLRIDSQTSWVSPPKTFNVSIAVSASAPQDQFFIYEAVYNPVRTRSEFAITLADDFARRPMYVAAVTPLSQMPADPSNPNDKLVQLAVNDPSQASVSLRTPGVYPVQLQLRDKSNNVVDKVTTHLLYLTAAPDFPKLNITWIVPFHTAPTLQPDGTHKPDTAVDSRLSQLAAGLTDPTTAKVPLVLQPTPETVDALTSSAVGDERSIITTLATAVQGGSGREVATSAFVPVNLAGLLDNGMGSEVAVQLTRGLATLINDLSVTPTASTWISQEPLDTTALSALAARGVTRLVVDERALVPINVNLTLTQPFQIATTSGSLNAVAADPAISGYFNDSRSVLAAHRLLADLAVLWNDKPREARGVVIQTPRAWAPDAGFLSVLLNGLAASPVLQPVTLNALFSVAPATVSPGFGRKPVPLVRSLALGSSSDTAPLPRARVTATRDLIDALRTVLPAGHPLIDDADRQLLVSEADALSPGRRLALVGGLDAQLRAQVSQFRLPANRTITLTARSARIPITVENDAPFPAKLQLLLKSQGLVFSGSAKGSQEVPLDLSHKFTTIEFTVRTRTSGVFGMTVELVAPNGTTLGPVSHVTIRSTAASGVGIILSVCAALFLVIWWVRNARSGRRARQLVPADDQDA